MMEEKDLLHDFLLIYLADVGFRLHGPDGEATQDEIEHLIEDYFRAPVEAA